MTSHPSSDRLRWKGKPFAELVRLAWPIGVSMLSYSVMTLVDTAFVARLGASALAGVGLGGIVAFTLLCFPFGLLRAIKVLVSQAVGAGRTERVLPVLGAGLLIALGLGLANIAVGLVLSPSLKLVAATEASAVSASAYLDVRVLAAPAALVAVALRESRYGLGDSTWPMRATIAANLANIALDYLLIVELGWGVRGAAWASVMAHVIEAGFLIAIQRGEGLGLGRGGTAELGRIWRLGLPIGGQMLLEISAFALLTVMFAAMSEVDLAAHQIALQVLHLSFLPVFAVGEAASVLIGQAVGADEDGLVPVVVWRAMALGAGYALLCALVLLLGAGPIASAFTDEPLLATTTVRLFYIAAAFQLFDAANIVARCSLRGAGDVRFAAVIAVTLAWVCTPPLAWLLGYALGLGVAGGWLGLCVELVAGAVILWWRLLRGGWRPMAERSRRELDDECVGAQQPEPVPASS